MKTTSLSKPVSVALAAGFIFFVGLFAGCGEDETDNGGVGPEPSDITVEEIIFNPKSAAPRDTLRLTAVVTSATPNQGDFVTYKWTASAGVLLEDDQSSVRWQAPEQSAVYTISVTAKNDVSTSSASGDIFVGQLEDFITEKAGQLYPMPSGGALYYTSAPGGPVGGLAIRFKDGANDQEVFPEGHRGAQYSFDNGCTHAAHFGITGFFPRRVIVVHDDLQALTQTTIASDSLTYRLRPNEYTNPRVSPDGKFICYQGSLMDQNTSHTLVDSFAVFVYDVTGGTTKRATFTGNSTEPFVPTCFYPAFSSDSQHLVFVSDRSAPSEWEYYALPIEGGSVVPDTIPDALVRLSNTGGQMLSGSSAPNLTQQWNPNAAYPILAVIGTDSKMRLIPADGTGAILVAAPGRVVDICWAPSGLFLVASVFNPEDALNRVYRVTPTGGFEELFAAVEGDKVADLTVSPAPDCDFVVCTITRGSNVWYELYDMRPSASGMPVRISPAVANSEAASYGLPLQSLRPSWLPGSKTAYLFFLDRDTPRVMTLDLSGIGQ